MIKILDQDFTELNLFIQHQNPSKIFILVDENTHEYCLPTLLGNLETTAPFEIIEIEEGEESKNINTAVQLWEILTEFSADRHSLLICLGGGVVTDIGGFVASTYKRGIPFIYLPTTLLAMADAAMGGKTGIDHLFFKNLIGTFAEPKQIFLYADYLRTLPFPQLKSGFAEMLKHGLVADAGHWQELISIENELSAEKIAPYLLQSAEIKQKIVQEDFHEKHIRKILNFGHTIGHAVESLFLREGTPLLHGEAVALGMICETYISYLQQLISLDTARHIIKNLVRFFPLVDISNFSDEEIIMLMYQDKKNQHGNICFSLIESIGVGHYNQNVPLENIISALDLYRNGL